MKKDNTYKCLILNIVFLLFLTGCTSPNDGKDVPIKISGPYTNDIVTERFGLDSLPLNVDSKNLFFATVSNFCKDTIKMKSTNDHRIFPDSTWHHSYAPYSAVSPSWAIMLYERESTYLELIDIPRSQSKSFWFSSYYDEYIDSSSIYF